MGRRDGGQKQLISGLFLIARSGLILVETS